jgi:hypothetical protein
VRSRRTPSRSWNERDPTSEVTNDSTSEAARRLGGGLAADALRRFNQSDRFDRFDRVTFAVPDGQPGAPTYRTFVDTFMGT